MSSDHEINPELRQVISQFTFRKWSDTDAEDQSTTWNPADAETAESWVATYRKYRRPIALSAWEWSSKNRPGKHCDSHLIDFFSCLDRTKDKLSPDDPSEKFCLPARELTTACMAYTLCEQKVYQVTQYCSETGSPNMRSSDCWQKIWEAQTCVQQVQMLLSKRFWASHPDLLSTADRYLLLLGSPTIPGKRTTGPDFTQRRKEFLERTLDPEPSRNPGEMPYVSR